ncbi:MAG: metallophosphoesterase, partial [Candidatus Thorarchaeota archaeon]
MDLLDRTGVSFPSQWHSMFQRVKKTVDDHGITHLYIIGDIKHSIAVDRMINWREIPEYMEALTNIVTTTVIPGNHDGEIEALLPRSVVVEDVRGITLEFDGERIGLVHGHAWPSPELLDCR